MCYLGTRCPPESAFWFQAAAFAFLADVVVDFKRTDILLGLFESLANYLGVAFGEHRSVYLDETMRTHFVLIVELLA